METLLGETLFEETIERDEAGYIVARDETFMGETIRFDYGYDGRRRLIGESNQGVDSAWEYDQNDNLIGSSHGDNASAFSYNQADQLVGTGEETLEYFESGELRQTTNNETGLTGPMITMRLANS